MLVPLVSLALTSPVYADVQISQKPLLESATCQKQKVLSETTCTGDDLEPEEIKLYELVNQYRVQHNLPPIPLSKSLTLVANRHAHDLAENIEALSHSWSNCPFNAQDAKTFPCMWSAPQRLKTAYPGYGFENAYISYGEHVNARKAFQGWQDHTTHNNVMLNRERWKNIKWNSVGVAVYKQYAVMWFGRETDPAGAPARSSTEIVQR